MRHPLGSSYSLLGTGPPVRVLSRDGKKGNFSKSVSAWTVEKDNARRNIAIGIRANLFMITSGKTKRIVIVMLIVMFIEQIILNISSN